MSFAVAAIVTGVAVAGATAYGAYTTSEAQKAAGSAFASAGNEASKSILDSQGQAITAQQGGTDAAMKAQQDQYAKIHELLTPYVDTGTKALLQQQNMAGLNGVEAQQQSYNALQNSPAFQALGKAGQDAILANASATGSVRGGNTQGALAQFGTANLANALDRQYGQLNGLTQLGYNATGQQAGYDASQGGSEASLLSTNGSNIAGIITSTTANAANAKLGGANANTQAQLGAASTMANLPLNALMGGLGAGLGVYGARGAMPQASPSNVPLFNQNVPFTQGGFKL
jgi:hypothetical protein